MHSTRKYSLLLHTPYVCLASVSSTFLCSHDRAVGGAGAALLSGLDVNLKRAK
jgi:hypothetical protein